jgi:hypothetical protein
MSLPDHGLPVEIQKDSAPVNSMNEKELGGRRGSPLTVPKIRSALHSMVRRASERTYYTHFM